ncbi:hypothetical protein ACFXCZ_27345 [Streptomyces sp. NPDC059396]|uniref:hypothetical protein n=1 Tax=Streptomyces sp. NPDC059396 TaxID=3346819 RepID=UPI0036AC027B
MNAQPIPETPTAVPPKLDPDVQHRDALMRALAAAESVISRLPVASVPKSIAITRYDTDVYELDLYFSEHPAAVREFGDTVDTAVTTHSHPYRPSVQRTEARATVQGVVIKAWTEINRPLPVRPRATQATETGASR